jgi:hypothetical protein
MTATAIRASGSPKRSPSGFPPELLRRIRETDEVRIEPEGSGGPVTIWAVNVGRNVYVRSYLARKGSWYRAALESRRAILHVGRSRVHVRVLPAKSPSVIERVSGAYRRKYARYRETEAMLKRSVAATTLRVLPA